MAWSAWFRGLLLGFSIAAPVGPIGVLCIRRTLARGRMAGFASGMGAASADALYGCIAGFGLTVVADLLVQQQVTLRLLGGAFLCYLGVRTFLAAPATEATAVQDRGLLKDYGSTFVLTLTNPMTILSFAAMFAGLGLAEGDQGYGAAVVLVLGVFTGSALWWLLLSGSVSLFRDRFTTQALRWVNRLSGLTVTVFGVFSLLRVIS